MQDPAQAKTDGPWHRKSIERRTFWVELARSLPIGVLETLMTTFGILVLIEYFEASEAAKSFLLSASKVGLLCSLFVVPLLYRLQWKVTTLCALIAIVAALGIGIAASMPDSQDAYLLGLGLAYCVIMLQVPLMTQIYRNNYPSERRGLLFSISAIVRGIAAVGLATVAGKWLDNDILLYRQLLWLFFACAILVAIAIAFIPTPNTTQPPVRIFGALRWLKKDKTFRDLIISWMILGLANLTGIALWVEYFSKELDFSTERAVLLNLTIPVAAKLITTLGWGWLFDRVNFYLLRIVLNLLFAAATFCVFFTENFHLIAVGVALQGIAFGGGNIAWSLWVTKITTAERVGEYMSVHTFMTGIRGVAAPFLGYFIIGISSFRTLGIILCLTMLASCILVVPYVRIERARRKAEPIAPREPGS